MADPEVHERIIARRVELDELEERLVKQDDVRGERDELAVAERVWQRMSEQLAAERAVAASPTVQVGGRGVLLVPRREPGVAESALPPAVSAHPFRHPAGRRPGHGPTGSETLGLDVGVRGKLEPLRGKLTKLADRG